MNKYDLVVNLAKCIAIFVMICLLLCGCAEQTASGEKNLVIDVVGVDGYENSYEVTTETEFLGQVLDELGIAEMQDSDFGRYIVAIDGYRADEKTEYWSINLNGDYATAGADELVVNDGDRIILAIDEF